MGNQEEKIVKFRLRKLWILAFLILLVAAVFTKGFGLFPASDPSDNVDEVINTDDFMSIPLSDITESAKWYEYDFSDNSKIKFFVVRANDGNVRTAIDACDVCYSQKKGYRQQGNYMVCNNCGNRYPIDGLGGENESSGGCWPGYLPNIVKENDVLIRKSDLENNQSRSL